MGTQVFISYASADTYRAKRLCGDLETAGVQCWIAARDIAGGEDYQDAIVAALEASEVMVVVLSANANASSEVKKEVAIAAQRRLPIVPVRIADVRPVGALQHQLSATQYVDLFGSATVADVIAAVKRYTHGSSRSGEEPAHVSPRRGRVLGLNKGLLAAGTLSIAGIVVAAVFWGSADRSTTPTRSGLPREDKNAAPEQPIPNLSFDRTSAGAESKRLFKRCADGDGTACNDLGVRVGDGIGTAKDYAVSARLYRRACALGAGIGCRNLAKRLASGKGVTQDVDQALAFYARACELRYARGCYELGLLVEQGRAGTEKTHAAADWFNEACEMGEPSGCDALRRQ